ncbi:hypothetical protein NCH01_14130 [Neoasaia chiangmaiensis]|nr:hypothetical protein NCH01_14130 [Neoasaia chiangmaiensis]
MIASQRAIALLSGFHGIWMDIRRRLAEEIRNYTDGKISSADLKSFVRTNSNEIDNLPSEIKNEFG